MIKYIEGNIFKSTVEIIINFVNESWRYGKKLALEFKINYFDMFDSFFSWLWFRCFRLAKNKDFNGKIFKKIADRSIYLHTIKDSQKRESFY